MGGGVAHGVCVCAHGHHVVVLVPIQRRLLRCSGAALTRRRGVSGVQGLHTRVKKAKVATSAWLVATSAMLVCSWPSRCLNRPDPAALGRPGPDGAPLGRRSGAAASGATRRRRAAATERTVAPRRLRATATATTMARNAGTSAIPAASQAPTLHGPSKCSGATSVVTSPTPRSVSTACSWPP